MGAEIVDIFERLDGANSVSANDVVALRRQIFSCERVRKDELEKLLRIVTEGDDCPEWQWLLNEACERYFLNSARPHGYFCDETLHSLHVMRGHNRANPAATKALVHVLTRCRAAPEQATHLAMELLEADVLSCGEMDPDKVSVLRDLLYAQGSFHGLGVSREEADLLFIIKDYLRTGHEHPDWIDLFCKAIGNHLMVQHGYVAPSRSEALRQELWWEDTTVNVAGVFDRMAKSFGDGTVLDAFKSMGQRDRDCVYKKRNDAFEAAAAKAAVITEEEAEWLADRIGRDGEFCDAEKALMSYVSALCNTDLPAILNRYAEAA